MSALDNGRVKRLDRALNPAYLLDWVVGAATAAFVVWLLVPQPLTRTSEIISDAVFFPLGLIVAWANFRNARVSVDRRTAIAWTFLGLSAVSLWVTGNTWTFYLGLVGPRQTPHWLDWLEPLQAVLATIAYLVFPGRPVERTARTRFALDAGLILVAGFSVAFHFSVWTQPDQPGTAWSYNAATLVVDWIMFGLAAVAIIQKRDGSVRIAAAILLAAHASGIVGNFLLSSHPGYRSGDAIDSFWFLAWALKWAAARVAWHRHRLGLEQAAVSADPAVSAFRGSVFAYVMVAGAFVVFVRQFYFGDPQYARILGYSTLAMVVLLFLRQIAALDENRRLFSAQLAQEGRFKSFVQNASDITVVADLNNEISWVSPAGRRILGDVPTLRTGFPVAALFPAQDAGRLVPSDRRSPVASVQHRTRLQSVSGEWRDIEVVATDLRDDPGVAGIVYNCRDVTDRMSLEQTLLHAQKLDAIGRLAGGLAHDLNNVLTVIRGYAELLRESIGEDANASSDLRHIEQAADKAAGVTKKLLGLSRNTAVQLGAVDINAVVRGLEPILKQVLTDRIEILLDCDPALGQVWADQGQIEQVLLNLVTNARDAMPNGGVVRILTFNCDGNLAPTESSALAPGAFVAIAVEDQGVGMPPDVQARIFEPFYSTKPPDRGMGLGLAMVRNIVTESAGHIHIESAPGRGSRFTIMLPRLSQAAVPAPDAAAPVAAADLGGFTVLVVDDEFAIRAVSRRILERQGCRVLEASSGVGALAVMAGADERIDALLTDLVMPQMDGRELIARVHDDRPDLPVVCMSGFADPNDDTSGLGQSVVALVTKPFSADALLRAVAFALTETGQKHD